MLGQVIVDKQLLRRHIQHALQDREQVTLAELLGERPLQQGLAELLAYLQLGSDSFRTVVDEKTREPVSWTGVAMDGEQVSRSAQLPRIIFTR